MLKRKPAREGTVPPVYMTGVRMGLSEASQCLMRHPHRHNDIELNFLASGTVEYLFGVKPRRFTAGQLSLFWAAFPHQVTAASDDAKLFWVHIPLSSLLRWRLSITSQIMKGDLIIQHVQDEYDGDHIQFRRLVYQLDCLVSEHRYIALLEIEARLRRLDLWKQHREHHLQITEHTGVINTTKAGKMACFISENYSELIDVADIANVAGLQPNSAMKLFKKSFGLSIVEFLTQYRIAHAQQLLATTEQTVLDVSLNSGFNSLSRFYSVFKEYCGQSPRDFRASLHVTVEAPMWRSRETGEIEY
jgi:AraC family transcriptional regulator, melibiose operon regulatory protein